MCYGLVKSFVYFSLGFFFFQSCLLFWGYKPVHYLYRRHNFQPGGSLNGVFMNGSSSFECRLSVMAPRKASEGRECFRRGRALSAHQILHREARYSED